MKQFDMQLAEQCHIYSNALIKVWLHGKELKLKLRWWCEGPKDRT